MAIAVKITDSKNTKSYLLIGKDFETLLKKGIFYNKF